VPAQASTRIPPRRPPCSRDEPCGSP
jgi:hypothetical protein